MPAPLVEAMRSPGLLRAAALVAALALAALAYRPGLSGGFLLDDYPNLQPLAALDAAPSPSAVAQYVLGGRASELGRPLANLSFALQHASWDGRPGDFLAVNLLLHLLNTALWFAVVVRLQRLGVVPPAVLLPAAAAAVWALSPVQGGAVLYVVQRMTLLAATFMLAGLLLYLAGRQAVAQGRRSGYLPASAGVVVGAGVGVLAKETAALLPLLILALEATLLRRLPAPPRWRLWSAAFLWLPGLLLAGYVLLKLPAFLGGYEHRPFTLGERLLTEARVLFLYLGKALLPSPAGIRFFYDDLVTSSSAIVPWTTAVALAGWAALIAAAIRLRRRAPLLSFAVAWYLVGHALEATVIPLELVYDHRNYAPLLGPVLALCAGWVHLLQQPAVHRLRGALQAAGAAYVALLAAGMWLSADLLGRPLEQARFWVQRQPESGRALYHYGSLLLQQGAVPQAVALYRGGLARRPDDTVLALSLFQLGCFEPEAAGGGGRAAALLRRDAGGEAARIAGLLHNLGEAVDEGRCPGQPASEALAVVDAALASPPLAPRRVLLLHAAARILHGSAGPGPALDRLEQAIAHDPQIPLLQRAVAWSLEAGDAARARRHLATAETGAGVPPLARWLFREEIRGTRRLVELYESLRDAAPD